MRPAQCPCNSSPLPQALRHVVLSCAGCGLRFHSGITLRRYSGTNRRIFAGNKMSSQSRMFFGWLYNNRRPIGLRPDGSSRHRRIHMVPA